MLRRIHSQSSRTTPARKKRPLRASVKKSSRRNPDSSHMTLGEALSARRNARHHRTNPAQAMTLGEALAARRNARHHRTNPAQAMTIREALASRRNPSVDRGELRTAVSGARSAYATAKDNYDRDPSVLNRKILERQRNALRDLQSDMASTASALRGGRKAPVAKKSTAKKSTAKSGVAGSTTAYKRLKARSTKSRFTRAFNDAFKKAKRSGKSVAVAQRSAIAAGKRAASNKSKSSARKNPASSVISAIASNASRMNPRKKSAAKKRTVKSAAKRTVSSRKPRTSSAISKHATSSTFYKRLKSAASKKKFVTEFNKAFRAQNARRGVTEAQAAARAALAANAKLRASRKNPASSASISAVASNASRMNPRKKKTTSKKRKSVSKKRTSTSTRGMSLDAAAKKSSLYKRLKSSAKKAAFVKQFKSVHSKIARKASSEAQANARAALSAYAKVNKGSKSRKNPLRVDVPRDNPSKRKSSSRKSSSSSRARGKRLKGGMRKSAMQVLSKYGAYVYRVVIGGKVVELKANKSSTVYKNAKKGGLGSVKLSKLKGKKNTPTSLNLRSVYSVVDGRPSKKDFQRAIDAWAGALDGGKIRGVSKKDIARTRMNPKNLRKHTVTALANPAPMSESFRARLMQRGNASNTTMDNVKLGGIGLGAFAGSLYISNYLSGVLGSASLLNVTADDVKNNSMKHIAREAIPVLLTGAVGGYGLYKKFVQKAAVEDKYVALCGGLVAGSVTSLIARTLVKSMGRMIPGFAAVASSTGDTILDEPTSASGFLLDNQSSSSLEGISDMSRLYGTHGLGRILSVPTTGSVLRPTPNMGLYEMGEYIEYPSQLDGVYEDAHGNRHHGDVPHRANPIHPGRISPIGANTQMVPNRAPAVPAGVYDINFKELREDLNLQEPLGQEDLDAEGLVEVYANGHQMRIIRCTPDVARQVAEANFGSIVGESRVVPGSVLVLANMWDSPQNHTLTDRLRLNRAPEVPKGASFPQAGGVFSRVAFSSLFPSASNAASFQEFGVRVK